MRADTRRRPRCRTRPPTPTTRSTAPTRSTATAAAGASNGPRPCRPARSPGSTPWPTPRSPGRRHSPANRVNLCGRRLVAQRRGERERGKPSGPRHHVTGAQPHHRRSRGTRTCPISSGTSSAITAGSGGLPHLAGVLPRPAATAPRSPPQAAPRSSDTCVPRGIDARNASGPPLRGAIIQRDALPHRHIHHRHRGREHQGQGEGQRDQPQQGHCDRARHGAVWPRAAASSARG